MSNVHRTGTGRIKYFADTTADDELRAELSAIGARTEDCPHVSWRDHCNLGCDDPQIPAPILALEDGAQ